MSSIASPARKLAVGTKTLISTVVMIDPVTARQWLEKYNHHNRPIAQKHVDFLTGVITRGEWVLNGDSIRFSEGDEDHEPRLIDGQHRLLAISEAGKDVVSFVTRGLPDDQRIQLSVDVNRVRSFADHLALMGVPNSMQVAAATNQMYRWENRLIQNRRTYDTKPTFPQLLNVLDRHPDLHDAVRGALADGSRSKAKMPPSVRALCRSLFAKIDPEDSDEFWSAVASGANMPDTDARFRLREVLIANAAKKHERYTPDYILAITIKAWNLWRMGTVCHQLSWKASGKTPEAFPEPRVDLG